MAIIDFPEEPGLFIAGLKETHYEKSCRLNISLLFEVGSRTSDTRSRGGGF